MITFKLETEYIELNKLLKVTQICSSGGIANHLITDKLVRVDGEIETRKRCKIRSGQRVTYKNKSILVE
ncbi:MAG: RNA-binding protein [Candidatus Margulisiibacteriota bacterium]|nr:MAG: RNA-binding protein [Candidatus Margulisbacteria bacterium GWF2_38_17]OGI10843.1 MAG: RNA-binding protein [Candidatus Margulisbacteria bacterium GWE2_39_32]PZM83529.1 MAG: RNA-binding protein [Candidatus Margulisiibacteriota bacterium]HCT85332.1 RNA-binding protein [Candidatus Margulisiibacteriota bacterium]HCY37142.1 RNA-binding protein [Candidatus Margulisiibacteriota bacterium]